MKRQREDSGSVPTHNSCLLP